MKRSILLVLLGFVVAGCSINHPVEKDYDQHLAKYGSETTLPTSDLDADYFIDAETMRHNYQFRAATVGYAHVWIVEFGKILDKTLASQYVQDAFGKLEKSSGKAGEAENLVEFDLESFEFKNYRAYTVLNIKVLDEGREVFNKTYRAEGRSQGGQMWGAGPFGMKNATLKSTKQSIDEILEQFISDLNAGSLAAK